MSNELIQKQAAIDFALREMFYKAESACGFARKANDPKRIESCIETIERLKLLNDFINNCLVIIYKQKQDNKELLEKVERLEQVIEKASKNSLDKEYKRSEVKSYVKQVDDYKLYLTWYELVLFEGKEKHSQEDIQLAKDVYERENWWKR